MMVLPPAPALPCMATDNPAPGWLLLRGLVRESRHWGEFPRQLAEHDGAPVRCLDIPGNGVHHDRRSPWSVPAMLEQVRAEAAIEQPVRLLGLSMGGMIAAEWASRYPQEVAGLVLINTSAGAFSPFWQRIRPGSLPLLLQALLLPAPRREAVLYRLTCRQQQDRDPTLCRWIEYARSQPVSYGNFLRQLTAAARYRCPHQPPPVPPLLLCSRGDRLVNPECSHALARHWQCRAHEHPWAGHDLPHDDPDWVLAELARYRERLDEVMPATAIKKAEG